VTIHELLDEFNALAIQTGLLIRPIVDVTEVDADR